VESSPPDSSQNGNGSGRVMCAVDKLPESQKQVILLKLNGLSLEETADATLSTAGAVKQKVHRAYQTLRHILTQRL
jgi:RNA polymerase sigma-70 factor (ECF subfamily)